jgi:hypothetical protein
MDCINLYISVLLGSGCSHSFLGTPRESMVRWNERTSIRNVEGKDTRENKEEDYLSPMICR